MHTKGQIAMDDFESLRHSKWDCKDHIVFIPKYRRKALYSQLRVHLGEVFRKLTLQLTRQSRPVSPGTDTEPGLERSIEMRQIVEAPRECNLRDGAAG